MGALVQPEDSETEAWKMISKPQTAMEINAQKSNLETEKLKAQIAELEKQVDNKGFTDITQLQDRVETFSDDLIEKHQEQELYKMKIDQNKADLQNIDKTVANSIKNIKTNTASIESTKNEVTGLRS